MSTAFAQSLPPFAKRIDRQDDLVMIYCGERAWRLASPDENRVASLAFPSGRDPQEYRWPVLRKKCIVFQLNAPQCEVDLLLIELLRQGAVVVFIDEGTGVLIEYSAPQRQAVA